MTELSPAAQAVLDAATKAQYGSCYTQYEQIAAAALRAAAEQCWLSPDDWEGTRPDHFESGWNAALELVSSIAAELEAIDANF